MFQGRTKGENKMLTVCRRTKDGKEFLEYYTCKSEEETNKEIISLNTTKPNVLWNGIKIDWNTLYSPKTFQLITELFQFFMEKFFLDVKRLIKK